MHAYNVCMVDSLEEKVSLSLPNLGFGVTHQRNILTESTSPQQAHKCKCDLAGATNRVAVAAHIFIPFVQK